MRAAIKALTQLHTTPAHVLDKSALYYGIIIVY
jgi:hypothetical protein